MASNNQIQLTLPGKADVSCNITIVGTREQIDYIQEKLMCAVKPLMVPAGSVPPERPCGCGD